ncbi:MAG: type II secretion system F family protein [Dechloromonas sp.]|nr:type II secretion system F family protein [Dechloromonas sp.]
MQFQIKAVDGGKGIISLRLDAPSANEARALAEHQGLRVMSLRPARGLPGLGLHLGRGQAFPLVLFSQELATLLNAGLALVNAIESLAEKEEEASRRKVLGDITRLLYEGKSFSQALAQLSGIFPELYVALIQSSEKTGSVGEALSRYVAYRNRIEVVKQKVIGASVYPALLIVVGAGVLLFLLGYVVPRFSAVFGDKGEHLPWLSQVMLATGQAIHDHIGALALGAGLAVVGATLLLRLPAVRLTLGHALTALPALRRRLFLYEVARLYRSLGILLQGGIPIVTAIGMARGLVGAAMRPRLDRAAQRIREGQPLSQALEQNQLSTPVSLRMLRAGEQAGNLGDMMERTADFYDEEMGRWIDWFVRLFEPLLMVFVGAAIGVVVILMYIPIFELAGSIQ